MNEIVHSDGCELERCGICETNRILKLLRSPTTIGRGLEMTYNLNSTFVSRHHATFSLINDVWHLTDQESLNGLYLNGGRMESGECRSLHRGDTIGFGVPRPKRTADERIFVYKLTCNCSNKKNGPALLNGDHEVIGCSTKLNEKPGQNGASSSREYGDIIVKCPVTNNNSRDLIVNSAVTNNSNRDLTVNSADTNNSNRDFDVNFGASTSRENNVNEASTSRDNNLSEASTSANNNHEIDRCYRNGSGFRNQNKDSTPGGSGDLEVNLPCAINTERPATKPGDNKVAKIIVQNLKSKIKFNNLRPLTVRKNEENNNEEKIERTLRRNVENSNEGNREQIRRRKEENNNEENRERIRRRNEENSNEENRERIRRRFEENSNEENRERIRRRNEENSNEENRERIRRRKEENNNEENRERIRRRNEENSNEENRERIRRRNEENNNEENRERIRRRNEENSNEENRERIRRRNEENSNEENSERIRRRNEENSNEENRERIRRRNEENSNEKNREQIRLIKEESSNEENRERTRRRSEESSNEENRERTNGLKKIKLEKDDSTSSAWNLISLPLNGEDIPQESNPRNLEEALSSSNELISIAMITKHVTQRFVNSSTDDARETVSTTASPSNENLKQNTSVEECENVDESFNCYSQEDDDVIFVSESFKPKTKSIHKLNIKQEVLDELSNFNYEDTSQKLREDYGSILQDNYNFSKPSSTNSLLKYSIRDDFSDSDDDNSNEKNQKLTNGTGSSRYVEDGQQPSTSYDTNANDNYEFFPVLSQGFYDGDSSNSFEQLPEKPIENVTSLREPSDKFDQIRSETTCVSSKELKTSENRTSPWFSKSSNKIVQYSEKKAESLNKQRFYATKLTEPLPRKVRGRLSIDRIESSKRTLRSPQTKKKNLKAMVKEQMGNRIPIPGGGSSVVKGDNAPQQVSNKSTNKKIQETEYTKSAKLKRTVKSSKKCVSRFRSSRSDFLTATVTTNQTAENSPDPIPATTEQENTAKLTETIEIQNNSVPMEVCNDTVPMDVSPSDERDAVSRTDEIPMEVDNGDHQQDVSKKKVRFSDTPRTRIIPNIARKNPKPVEKNHSDIENVGPQTSTTRDLTLDDFIGQIVSWNPSWLEQQKRCPKPPNVIGNLRLRHTMQEYKTYDEYFDIFKPLLLMETWAVISKDYENNCGQLIDHEVVLERVHRIPRQQTRTMEVVCQNLCSRDDICRRKHLQEGQVVILHIPLKHENAGMVLAVFAYLKNVEKRAVKMCQGRISPAYDKHVLNKRDSDASVLTCTFHTKLKDVDIDFNKVTCVKILSYLKPSIRNFQALLHLPKTMMVRDILQPRQRTCSTMPNPLLPFIPKGNYNKQQRDAILAITEACAQGSCPKICLLQGPPGTGKSHTIIGLIEELLYAPNMKEKCGTKPKILLTAASNAAVDELVRRLIELKHSASGRRQLKFVRVGNNEQVHIDVKKYTLESLVKDSKNQGIGETSKENIDLQINYLEAKANSLQTKLDSAILRGEKDRISSLEREQEKMRKRMLDLQRQNAIGPPSAAEIYKIEEKLINTLLQGADIIATTLSSCRQSYMENTFSGKVAFSACIIDEASQCIEVASILPLLFGISKLILVGDPEQLPATVLCQQASDYGLNCSLFERLYRHFKNSACDNTVLMLTTQYRMHSEICKFPSSHFYDGKLVSDISLEYKYRRNKFHPFLVFNLDQMQETSSSNGQVYNVPEVDFVILLISVILEIAAKQCSIGIITPYQAQRRKFCEALKTKIPDALNIVEVNTVDGFQGREKDIIILSTVRAKSENGSIGFLTQEKRLNVALTRAKQSCFICGHLSSLEVDPHWRALTYDSQKRGLVINITADVNLGGLKRLISKFNS